MHRLCWNVQVRGAHDQTWQTSSTPSGGDDWDKTEQLYNKAYNTWKHSASNSNISHITYYNKSLFSSNYGGSSPSSIYEAQLKKASSRDYGNLSNADKKTAMEKLVLQKDSAAKKVDIGGEEFMIVSSGLWSSKSLQDGISVYSGFILDGNVVIKEAGLFTTETTIYGNGHVLLNLNEDAINTTSITLKDLGIAGNIDDPNKNTKFIDTAIYGKMTENLLNMSFDNVQVYGWLVSTTDSKDVTINSGSQCVFYGVIIAQNGATCRNCYDAFCEKSKGGNIIIEGVSKFKNVGILKAGDGGMPTYDYSTYNSVLSILNGEVTKGIGIPGKIFDIYGNSIKTVTMGKATKYWYHTGTLWGKGNAERKDISDDTVILKVGSQEYKYEDYGKKNAFVNVNTLNSVAETVFGILKTSSGCKIAELNLV